MYPISIHLCASLRWGLGWTEKWGRGPKEVSAVHWTGGVMADLPHSRNTLIRLIWFIFVTWVLSHILKNVNTLKQIKFGKCSALDGGVMADLTYSHNTLIRLIWLIFVTFSTHNLASNPCSHLWSWDLNKVRETGECQKFRSSYSEGANTWKEGLTKPIWSIHETLGFWVNLETIKQYLVCNMVNSNVTCQIRIPCNPLLWSPSGRRGDYQVTSHIDLPHLPCNLLVRVNDHMIVKLIVNFDISTFSGHISHWPPKSPVQP